MTVPALIDRLRRPPAWLRLPQLPARHAQVVQALPLGPGARLLVVEFGGRRLLVGQSRAGLATLAEADAP